MIVAWLVDGSNVLGALRWNRESRVSKERLATLCARFARGERKRMILCFDGAEPSGFVKKLGGLSVRFSHPVTADEVIVSLARDSREPWTVVTSDGGIASRVRRRATTIMSSQEFAKRLESLAEEGEGTRRDEDWDDYFSDPKNRIF